ncbi:LolA family protein [Neobacillus jeddahensis]|uniref:LolA family protein n=1 Tax=Neobacillus jeddahensis TaxID=1461580 RepID=UPI000590D033|nr:sigma-E factor regulatory protein RseB domain-containing protein [Neobacillus jeddahensis]
MDHKEKQLSDFIDRLNAEQRPAEDDYESDSPDMDELFQMVRRVKRLKEPVMPEADFQKRLTKAVELQLIQKKPTKKRKWLWLTSIASVAAILALMINFLFPFGNANIVNAMEEAFNDVQAYHGTLEIVETNANGNSTTQAKLEVWANKDGNYYIKWLEGSNKDVITVNNGQKKWQIQPTNKQVQVFSAFPDAYRFIFELGNEIKGVKAALSTKVVGDDTVAGRKATIVEVTPKGGSPYRIWIDRETKLPLQKQTAMQNAIQYRITYTKMDFSKKIPDELISYHVPEGFKVIDTNPEQVVTDLNEAKAAVGFTPKTAKAIPAGYFLKQITVIPQQKIVKMYYQTKDKAQTIIFVQGKAVAKFTPAPTAILGKINQNNVEIQSPITEDAGVLGGGSLYAGISNVSSIRWQQDGVEFAIVGNASLEELVSFTEELTNGVLEIPSLDDQTKPQVTVPYDITVEENDQKSVDAGSSPWKLDPVFTTQVFVSLKISPQGISGDYPINSTELKIVKNDGKVAIVEVSGDKSPIKTVYLKRVVRQDATGIWTVVGYDPVE